MPSMPIIADLHGFKPGDAVRVIQESRGADHEDVEHTMPAGSPGKIDHIDVVGGDPSKWWVTVVIPIDDGGERHIVNVFDHDDGPLTNFIGKIDAPQ